MSDYTDTLSPQNKNNKYEVAEIEFIQQEIQLITKKIEHEKISLRILEERYNKKQSDYAKLEGRPSNFTREQRMNERRERQEKIKQRKISERYSSGEKREKQPQEENALIKKKTAKCEIDLENITKEINNQKLQNEKLINQIIDLRKDKTRLCNQLQTMKDNNRKIENDIDSLVHKNKVSVSKIKFEELAKTKEEESEIQKNFEINRDELEGKYHEIIETNIKREREHKKELSKKRLMLGLIAENVKSDKNKGKNTLYDQMKLLENDNISDRTPILDVLIDKWKYITKYKKNMIDKYNKNSQLIKEAFQKILVVCGLDSIKELPIIFEKMENQMTSVEFYNSQISNEIAKLEEKKNLLTNQIKVLRKDKNDEISNKAKFVEEKKKNISELQTNNEQIQKYIDNKREFFLGTQPSIVNFLNKIQRTYLSEFVPNKITINELTKFTENNVDEFFICVNDYCALIYEFDKSTNRENNTKSSSQLNKELDKLKKDIETKLGNFNAENCVNDSFYTSIKNDLKTSSNFDETMKKMARIIVSQFNAGETTPFKGKQVKDKVC